MAFSTIPGTGGAPDVFVGTSGVDAIVITNVSNAVDLKAFASDDSIEVANVAGFVSGYTLLGGSGNDIFATTATTLATASRINGNEGNDTITLNAFGGVSVTDSTVVGGKGNDTIVLTGSLNSSLVNGNLDDDTITTAGASNSSVFGGQGVDTININGTTVLTVINGDKENDTINVAGSVNQSTINGGDGNDTVNLLAGITSFADSSVFGGDGRDTLNGAAVGAFNLVLSGDAGDDTINSGGGADSLFGGIGNDVIDGGAGADTITGGVGADRLTGGLGNDRFVFATGDSFAATGLSGATVSFNNGVDVINNYTTVNGAGDSVTLPAVPTNVPNPPFGILGNSASIVNGQVIINQAANTLNAGLNRFFISGLSNGGWNQDTRVFTNTTNNLLPTADYLVFQATLAAPLAAGTAGMNITQQFNLAEVVILNDASFT